MNNNRFPVLSLALLIAFGGAIFYMSKQPHQEGSLFEKPDEYIAGAAASTISATPGLAEAIASPDEPPEGYVEYRNERYGFYYYHSPEAAIKEYDEGGGAMTVVQENAARMRGLQIFIVPYEGEVITEERFNRDVPSGVRYNIEDTAIARRQVPAVTFNSYDQFLGDTREVWFIHNGFLFEVTTFKGFGDWFSDIMQTWRFI